MFSFGHTLSTKQEWENLSGKEPWALTNSFFFSNAETY